MDWYWELALNEEIPFVQPNMEAIRRLFRVPHNRSTEIKPQPSIFPGWDAPVIRRADDGERELVQMS